MAKGGLSEETEDRAERPHGKRAGALAQQVFPVSVHDRFIPAHQRLSAGEFAGHGLVVPPHDLGPQHWDAAVPPGEGAPATSSPPPACSGAARPLQASWCAQGAESARLWATKPYNRIRRRHRAVPAVRSASVTCCPFSVSRAGRAATASDRKWVLCTAGLSASDTVSRFSCGSTRSASSCAGADSWPRQAETPPRQQVPGGTPQAAGQTRSDRPAGPLQPEAPACPHRPARPARGRCRRAPRHATRSRLTGPPRSPLTAATADPPPAWRANGHPWPAVAPPPHPPEPGPADPLPRSAPGRTEPGQPTCRPRHRPRALALRRTAFASRGDADFYKDR
eukprot:scaffold9104_cov100-Isochrysis_galbana.AAC.3